MERVYLLLGTNLGDRYENLSTAVSLIKQKLSSHLLSEIVLSSIHETVPDGFVSDNLFLNQAVGFDTNLDPHSLLVLCKQIEAMMGRADEGVKYDIQGERIYHSRVIDIDILLFGDRTINLPDLIIPHPRMYQREFAMIPLKEILSNQ